jgi:hypothetical protein
LLEITRGYDKVVGEMLGSPYQASYLRIIKQKISKLSSHLRRLRQLLIVIINTAIDGKTLAKFELRQLHPQLFIQNITNKSFNPCVEAGSNTSTVTLQVVGGDKKGSLKSETVKYGRESQGLGPKKDCAGKGQQHI